MCLGKLFVVFSCLAIRSQKCISADANIISDVFKSGKLV